MTDDTRPTNRLITEKSPYLLAHAHQPVDWFPWGDEAFERARELDRPVFLSIGYATCHWCHVMARESFEDPEVARLLNEAFVCIKVDREERPDVDQLYMTVCHLLTGSGGWPLTVIMTPDRRPFFAGTYFPRESRLGATGVLELVPRLAEMWTERRSALDEAAEEIIASLSRSAAEPPAGEVGPEVLRPGFEGLALQFDSLHGGFGHAPKFPTPHHLLFLLRYWHRTGEAHALEMVARTLEAIRRGGVFDQVGYGLHRYSTDTRWLVPHFEKMLYDQALFVFACVEAFQATGEATYRRTAEETLTYLLGELRSPEGAFFSAQDADSEGEEGKFYLWTKEELDRVLAPEEAEVFNRVYRVRTGGNFVDPADPERRGLNVLHRAATVEEAAKGLGRTPREVRLLLEAARERLYAARALRVRPAIDDKVLASWNGLAIAALAAAGRAFGHRPYIEAAERALDFVLVRLRTPDNRLLHRYRDGEAAIPGLAEDYAYLAWGLLEVYAASFDPGRLATARSLVDRMLSDFWDGENGGLFSAAAGATDLLVRQKETFDGAYPSANSAAYLVLVRLGRLTGDPVYEERAAAVARLYAGPLASSPTIATLFLAGLEVSAGDSQEVVVVGAPGTADTDAMLGALQRAYLPATAVLFLPLGEKGEAVRRLAPFTAEMTMVDAKATAYVCKGRTCELPVTDVPTLLERLGDTPKAS